MGSWRSSRKWPAEKRVKNLEEKVEEFWGASGTGISRTSPAQALLG